MGDRKVLIETGRFVEDQATEARLNQKKKMGDTSSSREGMGFKSKENADHARQAKIMMGGVKGILKKGNTQWPRRGGDHRDYPNQTSFLGH